jgi:hypothetical protein
MSFLDMGQACLPECLPVVRGSLEPLAARGYDPRWPKAIGRSSGRSGRVPATGHAVAGT